MYIDNYLTFSSAQAITATAASTNVVDLVSTNFQDDGEGCSIETLVVVNQAFNNLTSLAIALQSSSASNFGTIVEIWTKTFPLAQLTANTQLPTPKIATGVLEFLRFYYTVTGTAPTQGTITATLVLNKQQNIPTLGLPNS